MSEFSTSSSPYSPTPSSRHLPTIPSASSSLYRLNYVLSIHRSLHHSFTRCETQKTQLFTTLNRNDKDLIRRIWDVKAKKLEKMELERRKKEMRRRGEMGYLKENKKKMKIRQKRREKDNENINKGNDEKPDDNDDSDDENPHVSDDISSILSSIPINPSPEDLQSINSIKQYITNISHQIRAKRSAMNGEKEMYEGKERKDKEKHYGRGMSEEKVAMDDNLNGKSVSMVSMKETERESPSHRHMTMNPHNKKGEHTYSLPNISTPYPCKIYDRDEEDGEDKEQNVMEKKEHNDIDE